MKLSKHIERRASGLGLHVALRRAIFAFEVKNKNEEAFAQSDEMQQKFAEDLNAVTKSLENR